jgi:hypothetical protein
VSLISDQAGISLPAGPSLQLTTARWLNKRHSVRSVNGQPFERWLKVLAHTGNYQQFEYGGDYPSEWQGPLQRCIICSPWSGAIALDIDNEELYFTTRTAQLIGRECALSTRGWGYHILLDARAVPADQWPTQGPITGADIKSRGFIPVPGSQHYTGEHYQPVLGPDGMSHAWPATPGLIAAIAADRADYTEIGRGHHGGEAVAGYSGGCSGHDGEVAASVLANVLRGLTKERCHQRWLQVAIPHDMDWPYDIDDFERHHRGAMSKAEMIRAREAALRQSWLDRMAVTG